MITLYKSRKPIAFWYEAIEKWEKMQKRVASYYKTDTDKRKYIVRQFDALNIQTSRTISYRIEPSTEQEHNAIEKIHNALTINLS